MKTKEEIENIVGGKLPADLEILLDIRDILEEIRDKGLPVV